MLVLSAPAGSVVNNHTQMISASRAGAGSVVVQETGTGTYNIADLGVSKATFGLQFMIRNEQSDG